ncbi:uncharacterized protein [Triticum aestivum]|uniref:uncharacterized protein n=1 Tax=Triticum aestivum TaxID=4565 RepID=UPI000843681C|nr:uncharacterized protein LOC123041872 [Triticum aestivum]
MARARVRHAGAGIADDVLREVFARLPGLQDLLRCAATCKRWFRLITDPAFLRQVGLWPETARRPSVLVGIFSQRSEPGTPVQPLKRKLRAPPEFLSLGSGGAHLRFNSFVDDDDGLFHLARPLASRRGFLLVRVLLPDREKLHLAVCRPLIDRRGTHLLPVAPFEPSPTSLDRDAVGWALLTSADNGYDGYANSDDRRQSTFQVLLIYTDEDGLMYTCSYSSSLRIWSVPTECCRAPDLTRCGPRAGVVTHGDGGTAHWLYRDSRSFYAVGVSSATAHASLTKIPIEFRHGGLQPPLLCTVEEGGSISFVNIREHGMLELWTKQEQDAGSHDHACEGDWLHSDLANLGDERIDLVFFAEKRGALLVQQGGGFFTIDLTSKEKMSVELNDKKSRRGATKYVRWTFCTSTWCSSIFQIRCNSTTPVLYEMDCVFDPCLFSLGGSKAGEEQEINKQFR